MNKNCTSISPWSTSQHGAWVGTALPEPPRPHLIADRRVPVHHPLNVGIQTGPGGAFGQSCRVRLLLPLPDNGLAAQPLGHGVLIAGTDLVISLQRLEGQREGL